MDTSMPTSLSPRDASAPPAPSPTHPPTPPADPPVEMDAAAPEKTEFSFTYELCKWSSIEEPKVYSPWQYFAGFSWRLLIFPRGNQVDSQVSVYLECGGPGERPEPAASSAGHHGVPHLDDMPVVMSDLSQSADESMDACDTDSANVPAPGVVGGRNPTQPGLDQTQVSSGRFPVRNGTLSRDKGKEPAPPPIVPHVWRRPARFWLGLKPTSRSPQGVQPMQKDAPHTFLEKDSDWGFREFCSVSLIQECGYEDDKGSLHIWVRIKLEDASPDSMFSHGTWDSRKMTGYVGFKNQGATCYMNSLLQTLYMVGAFRRAVYNMPLPDGEEEGAGGSRMSYALQKVFYELQYSSTTVKTKKLTESFGWDNTDAFTQHDVQELNRILCDHLEERMKKIAPDQPNTVSQLFEGKILNYIECVNVNYKSEREESFYDLSLNVKGCRNIYDSFDKYCEVEMMDGDNKYAADGHDELQEARKGVKFLRLPPVLQLHLKRFEYDLHRDAMVKINDRFEYMTEIDLSRYVEKSDGADIYLLHSVLVHIGDVNGGHYYAYIRPSAKSPSVDPDPNAVPGTQPSAWYKFDDDMVTATTEEAAVAENFGSGGERDANILGAHGRMPDDIVSANPELNGNQTPPSVYQQSRVRNYAARRLSNAYMLQYIRKDQADSLLTAASDEDVPEALAARIDSEQREEDRQRRDRAEQHLYMNVIVATDKDMAEHDGADVIGWDKVRSLRVKRAMRLRELKMMLQDQRLVADWRKMRLWKCGNRRNQSIRPEALLADGLDESPIAERGRDYSTVQSMHYGVGYQSRYGLHTEYLKVYVEDFLSPFCLHAGKHFTSGARHSPEGTGHNTELAKNSKTTGDADDSMKDETELDMTVINGVSNSDSFKLLSGEMLLFLKRYVASPVPHLEWSGHCVVDRHMIVSELFPTLHEAVKRRVEYTPESPDLDASAPLAVFEEFNADSILEVDPRKTFDECEIPGKPESLGGDILVFMDSSARAASSARTHVDNRMVSSPSPLDASDVSGENSFVYNQSLPLGGRPLPSPGHFYKYLLQRVKIEFKDKYEGDAQTGGIVLEVLAPDTYLHVREILASVLGDGCDAEHLRFFTHDPQRDGPVHDSIRAEDDDEIRRMLPSHAISLNTSEYRCLWFERTEYAVSEYENKEEVRVTWRPDGGCRSTPLGSRAPADVAQTALSSSGGTLASTNPDSAESMQDVAQPEPEIPSSAAGTDVARTFSVLVPIGSRYKEVEEAITTKLGLDAGAAIRLMEVRNFRVTRYLDHISSVSGTSLPTFAMDVGCELRAEFISDEEMLDPTAEDCLPISVSHIAKDPKTRAWRGPVYFGVPIVMRISKSGEPVHSIRDRIRKRLSVTEEVFETWQLVEVFQGKVTYLEDMAQSWVPETRHMGGIETCALAIEHYGTTPSRKTMTPSVRFPENHKPLKIKS